MPPEESPDARYERLKKQLQDAILNDYPNPERRGCPGDVIVKHLAERPLDDDLEGDPQWQHVTHCSECYREFLAFRAAGGRRLPARNVRVAWVVAAAAVVLAAGVALFVSKRGTSGAPSSQPPTVARVFRPRLVDLEGRAMTRSEEGKQETKPILLGREPEELTIRLPFGSKAGRYEVQLLKDADHALTSLAGEATIRDGVTALTTRVDLSPYPPGRYFIGVRRPPWDWTYYPAVLE
jgi:hypothetical protein